MESRGRSDSVHPAQQTHATAYAGATGSHGKRVRRAAFDFARTMRSNATRRAVYNVAGARIRSARGG
eukprot:3467552-Rhodomonas_salina.1